MYYHLDPGIPEDASHFKGIIYSATGVSVTPVSSYAIGKQENDVMSVNCGDCTGLFAFFPRQRDRNRGVELRIACSVGKGKALSWSVAQMPCHHPVRDVSC